MPAITIDLTLEQLADILAEAEPMAQDGAMFVYSTHGVSPDGEGIRAHLRIRGARRRRRSRSLAAGAANGGVEEAIAAE